MHFSSLIKLIQNTKKQLFGRGLCDIRNNQGRGKCYQPSRRPRLITLTETLIIPDITKTESNNCFIIHCFEEKERQTHPRKEPELILPFGNHALLAQPTD